MKVILLKDVKKIGKKDDILDVNEGHARNHLIPNKLAVEADKKNLNSLHSRKNSTEKRNLANIEEAKQLASKLKNETVEFHVKENEGKVFGSITGKSIADRLIKLGYQIDKKSIDLPRPINTLGDFKVKIKLYTSIYAEVSVVIKKEEN
tara:strand:+ start:4808 stop:5254 length:447 start_codon:yes stop_codon:yes gene_type:complete